MPLCSLVFRCAFILEIAGLLTRFSSLRLSLSPSLPPSLSPSLPLSPSLSPSLFLFLSIYRERYRHRNIICVCVCVFRNVETVIRLLCRCTEVLESRLDSTNAVSLLLFCKRYKMMLFWQVERPPHILHLNVLFFKRLLLIPTLSYFLIFLISYFSFLLLIPQKCHDFIVAHFHDLPRQERDLLSPSMLKSLRKAVWELELKGTQK